MSTTVSSMMEGEKKNINTTLWLECAGPLVTLPTVGSHVVYFPQGHSEQVVASTQNTKEGVDIEIPNYPSLPSQLICQLHNITLHADQETDEVYAQMTLQPIQNGEPYVTRDLGIQAKQPMLSFCKTLTASDTSTHGGFSIPRRAAEKVFPPLDFTKTPPAQELVAKDLHNNEWHFRHIYRGQPRRHLLTTGWSVFVSAKRLQAGDTVLFMRDENNQLLLGIRRANRQQANVPSSLLSSDSMLIGVLAAAAHAASTNSRFTIFYNPRASYSEFVVPFCKFNKATYLSRVSVGMRFRMELETEDSSTRRYMGTITGIGDLDPVRWPNSLWRTLKVGWDESTAGQRQRRVSLWEIEPLTAPYFPCSSALFMRKRPRLDGELDDMSRLQIWARGEEGKMDIRALTAAGLNIDHWLGLPQKQPDIITSSSSQHSDHYRAMAAQALQEFQATSKQPHKQQQQQAPVLLNPPVIQMTQQQQLAPQHHQFPQQLAHQVPQQAGQHNQQQQQYRAFPQQQQQQQQQQYNHLQQHQQQHQQSQQQQQQRHQFLLSQQQQQQQAQPHALALEAGGVSREQAPLLQQQLHHHQQQQTSISGSSSQQHGILTAARMPSSAFGERDSQQQPVPSFPTMPMTTTNQLPHAGLLNGRPGTDALISDSGMRSQVHHQAPGVHDISMSRDSAATHSSVLSPRPIESSPASSSYIFQQQQHQQQQQQQMISLQQAQHQYLYGRDPAQEQDSAQSDPRSHLLFGVSIDSPLVLPSGDLTSTTSLERGPRDAHFTPMLPAATVAPPAATTSACSPSSSDMHMNSAVPIEDSSTSWQQSQQQQQPQVQPVRTFTKVHKTGSVGRSIDVTRLKNYDDLRREIARMFGLEGQLGEPSRSSWQLVFVDNERDVLLVGDDPWEEFVTCVRSIKILSPSEVLQMSREGIEGLTLV